MDDSTCIDMYYNIKRNIMKTQSGSLDFWILEKIFMYICFIFYAITIVYFLFLEFVCR